MFRIKSIRTQLTLLALAAAVPLLVLLALEIGRHYQSERDSIKVLALARAREVSAQVDALASNVDVLLTAISRTVATKPAFERDIDVQLRAIKAELPNYFDNVSIIGRDGTPFEDSGATPIPLTTRNYFQETVMRRRLTVSEPTAGNGVGEWLINFARPVVGANGDVRAVALTSVRIDGIQELLSTGGLPPNSIITVINQDGVVIARSADPRQWVGKSVRDRPIVQQILAHKNGVHEDVTADGVSRLAGYASATRVPWAVYVGIPTAAAFAPARLTLMNGVWLALFALAVSAILVALLAARIAGPVRQLRRDTAILAAGTLSHRTKVSGADEVAQLAAAFNDMAQSLEAQEDAREQLLKRFELVSRAANDVIWDWDLGNDTLSWSGSLLTVLGYRPEEIKSRSDLWDRRVHADDRQRVRDGIDRIVESGERTWDDEYRLRKADGSYAHIYDRGYVLRDEHGRGVRMIGAMQDISDRKRATEELRASEERYRYLFESNPHPMWIYDVKTLKFLAVNQTVIESYGYTREDFETMTLRDIRPREDLADFDQALSQLDRMRNSTGVWRHCKKDGTIIDVEVVSHAFTSGDRPARLGLANDVTARVRAQRALEESEQRYRHLFDLTPLPMWVRDDESLRFLEVNDAALRAYGYTRDQFLSMTTWDIRPPEDVERYKHVLLHGHNTLSESRAIGRHRKQEGTIMDVEVTSHAVVFKRRAARLTVINDITQRRLAEEALRDAERKYRTLFEDSPDGVMLVDPTDGTIIEGNQALRQMLGFSRAELSRLTMAAIEAAPDPERALVRIEKVKREGSDEFETRLRTRSGTILDALIRIRVLFIGSTMRFMTVVRNITERKLTEQALRESEERLRTVANNVPALIGYIDAGQRYRYVNRTYEDWYGKPASEYFGRTLREVIGAEMYARLRPQFEAALRGETVTEERRTQSQDEERYARFTYVPQFGADGKVLGFYVLGYDITERHKAEDAIRELNVELERRVLERTAQLESANQELEAFSYSVSHDLRAPLRSIDGFSQALLEEYHPQLDEQGVDFLQRIRKSSQRMAQLIDDLLGLSRVTRTGMVRARVDLSAAAHDIAADLQKAQPAREVEFVIAPGLAANADPNLMRVVLDNLLANAWKFSARVKSARIEFGETVWQGRRVFFVRDNGAGFDMTYADKLFGAFQRLHDAKEFQGTGIGLATVQRIVRRHGGAVWGEGKVNQGATFYFSIDSLE